MPQSALARLFWPPVIDDDYLEAARKRCLLVISLTAALAGLWSGSRDFAASLAEYPLQTVLALAAPAVLLLCPVLIAKKVSTRKVAWFFLAVTFAAMLAVPFIAGGMFSHATFFMLSWAVLTTLFLGWREGLAAAALVFCSYLTLHHFRGDIAPSVYDISADMISGWLLSGLSLTLLILIIGAAIIQRETERATARLIEARAEAEAASRAKSEFLAKMSHEIRTPMNGVLGMAEMLKRSDLTKDQLLYADTIMASGKSLLTIINDILDFSKIEAGRLELRNEAFSVKELIEQTRTLFAASAKERRLELSVHYDSPLPEYVCGDADRIRQIMVNLVGNALKFTNEGFVKVCVSADVQPDAKLKFDVVDSGVGIPADRLESIFESFEQVEMATTRRFDGTGLGLTISKQLARAMGGDITVTSVPGEGSTFTFSVILPVATGKPEAEPEDALCIAGIHEKRVPPNIAAGQRIRVLIAEDNEVNRLVIKTMIDATRCELDFAVNGREAVDAYRTNRYDVVLMDISMPEMDGLAAARAIRKYESETGGVSTPIICVTAHATTGVAEQVRNAGMDDILTKPLNARSVMAALEKWTGWPQGERQSA